MDWMAYGACPICGAAPGVACTWRVRAVRVGTVVRLVPARADGPQRPHPGRSCTRTGESNPAPAG